MSVHVVGELAPSCSWVGKPMLHDHCRYVCGITLVMVVRSVAAARKASFTAAPNHVCRIGVRGAGQCCKDAA
jgi:hypothetical protein